MSPVQVLRDFINERLTAAAAEIFTLFQQTIVQYEEEIDRRRKLLGITWTPQVQTGNPHQQLGHQISSNLKQEEHEAPHIKEEEDVVEVTVTDGESDNSLDSVRNLTTQRLTAAAGEIFTVFEQTLIQYEEEIDRQRSHLGITWKPQVKFHTTVPPELQHHRDFEEEQLYKLETDFCPKQEEPEPPHIKEEPEEPGLLQFKEEHEEPEPPQIEDQEELGCSHEGDQLIMKVGSGSSMVPSTEEQSFLSDPQEEPDTERFFSQDSEVHHMNKHLDSESSFNAELEIINTFPGDGVNDAPVSETMSEGEKLFSEKTSGGNVRKKQKSSQNEGTVSDKKVVCGICGKFFKKQAFLLIHTRTHTGEKPYPCESCGESFSVYNNLLVHMRTHTGEKLFSCETCGSSFTKECNLLRHMRTHTGEKPYSCNICGKSFGLHNTLSGHMRTHTGEKPYSCETCGKSFSQHSSLMTHTRTHTDEKHFSCETCGKRFNQQSNMLRHMGTHTGEKPYSCAICSRSFSVQSYLARHMKTHTGEKLHSCKICSKRFTQHGSLLCHIRTHTGEKPYSCESCGKSFSELSGLRTHMKTHTGEKPYCCGTCGKRFNQQSNMLRHMRTHSGEKPYSCVICSRSFSVQSYLARHMKTHTGEKPYCCGTCGKSFRQQGHLLCHMKTHKEMKSRQASLI